MKQESKKYFLNRRGQAAIEYILLLIVTVSLLFASRGMFSSLNDFMSDFMGEYVVCLMEYGELPALGVQNDQLKKHTTGSDGRKCEFRKFSFTASSGGSGSSPGGSGGSGSSSSSASSSNSSSSSKSKNSSSSSNSNGDSQSSAGADSSSGSGGSSASGKSSSKKNSPYSRGDISRSGSYATADAANSPGNDKIKVIEEDANSGRGRLDMNSSSSRSRRYGSNNDKYRAVTGDMAQEIDKKTKKDTRRPSSKVMQMSEDGYRFMPYKKTFSPPKVEKFVEEKKDEDLGFGKFIKWLIIAGILIACFILFGGQIMNYSNSGD